MRTLRMYVIRQVMATLGMSVAVFSFLLVLVHVLRQVVGLMMTQGAGLGIAFQATLYLIPYVLVYSLPIGMLTAVLLVFGRLSADNEITACRASGLSLGGLAAPLLIISLFFSAICAYVNLELEPRCRHALKTLLYEAGQETIVSAIQEGTFIDYFDDMIFYIGKREGDQLYDVLFYQMQDRRKVRDIRSREARLVRDEAGIPNGIEFYDALIFFRSDGDDDLDPLNSGKLVVPLEFRDAPSRKRKVKEMSFRELQAEKERLIGLGATPADLSPVILRMHTQLSFSFASFGFTLIGIPLGIRAHRRETTTGMAIAIVLLLLYNAFFIMGKGLETNPEYFPHLLVWLPNLVFQAVGVYLFRRADKGV